MTRTVQYRVVVAKRDERIEGPDDADVVITVPHAAVVADDFDPAVAFMQGVLKATGSAGALFGLLRSGDAAAALTALADTL